MSAAGLATLLRPQLGRAALLRQRAGGLGQTFLQLGRRQRGGAAALQPCALAHTTAPAQQVGWG